MGIDYGYPNDDAMDAIGILDQYNEGKIDGTTHLSGWIQGVIDQVEDDLKPPPGKDRTGSIDWSDYSTAEHDAYNWYKNDVLPQDKWDEIVKDWKDDSATADKADIHPDKFDPDKDSHFGLDDKVTLPDTQTYTDGKDNSTGDLLVSTKAIRYFANQLRKVADVDSGVALDAEKKFEGLGLKPGQFYVADQMRISYGNAIPDTKHLLRKVNKTLYELGGSLFAMADSYDKTEDNNTLTGQALKDSSDKFNHMTPDQLNGYMSDPWGDMSDLDKFGDTAGAGGDGGGGGGDSDGDDGGEDGGDDGGDGGEK